MKRKVKKYAGGEVVTSRGGDTNMRLRSDEEFAEDSKFGGYGRYMPKSGSLTRGIKSTASEDRPTTSGVEDYESGGKRAGVTSPFAGPKEFITDSSKEDAYKETESDEPRRKITDYSTNKGTTTYLQKEDAPSTVDKVKPKKKKVPKYEDTGAKIGNQSFMPSDAERRRRLEEADKPLEGVHPESYLLPGPFGALSKLATATRLKKLGPELNTVRAPMQKALEYTGNQAKRLTNEPLKLGMKKGGATKKMASGGKVSSASSRGDGIAQRGKTRGRMC
jgi:hypothetical protein